jgi:serine/threonine protein kinase
MGEVYRAKDTRLDRLVAVKVLSPRLSADANLRQRFEREARVISSLNHPNIYTLYDVGETATADPIRFLVMELVRGNHPRRGWAKAHCRSARRSSAGSRSWTHSEQRASPAASFTAT